MNYQAIEAVVRGVVPVVREHIKENSEPLSRRIDAFEAQLAKRLDVLEAANKALIDKAVELEVKAHALEAIGRRHDDTEKRLSELEARQPERGEKGEPGDAGVQGERGERGEKGEAGERGETGAPGERGERGEKGEPGDAGVRGERGEPGERGEKGEPGDAGAPGDSGKDADPHEIAAILEPAIERSITLQVHEQVGAQVAKAMESIGVPQDGRDGLGIADAMVDIEGRLVLTMSDGTTKALGRVVGRDGRDGLPGGPQGSAGPAGPPGNDGKSIEYLGTWDREKTYVEGNLTTWDGSMWSCKQETAGEMPGRTDAWVLVCKKGTPGREGRGIKSAKVDSDGQLVITYTDDTVQKAGRVRGDTGRPGRDFEPI